MQQIAWVPQPRHPRTTLLNLKGQGCTGILQIALITMSVQLQLLQVLAAQGMHGKLEN
jgi:hypothetical protein